MIIEQAIIRDAGLSVGMSFPTDKQASGVFTLEDQARAFFGVLPFPVLARLNYGALFSTLEQNENSINAVQSTISVKVLQPPADIAAATLTDAEIAAFPIWWEYSFIIPADVNQYAAKTTCKEDLPIPAGRVLIVVTVNRKVFMPRDAKPCTFRADERINIAGTPNTGTEDFYATMITTVGNVISKLDAQITALGSVVDSMTALSGTTAQQITSLNALTAELLEGNDAQVAELQSMAATMESTTAQQVAALTGLSTQIAASSGVIDYSAKLIEIDTALDLLHTDLTV